MTKSLNAWIALDNSLTSDDDPCRYSLTMMGQSASVRAMESGDWVIIHDSQENIRKIGRVIRRREDHDATTVYFDKLKTFEPGISFKAVSLSQPLSDGAARVQWTDFVDKVLVAIQAPLDGIPTIEDQAYVRDLLQLAVTDDLLGPAGGPREQIIDMSVRDRYLVGKLAPQQAREVNIEGLSGALSGEEVEEPAEPLIPGQHEPGEEFGRISGRIEPESDSADDIDATNNQSLVPSSMGLTFCVDGDVDRIEVEVRWGRYERVPNDEHEHTKLVKRRVRDSDGNVIDTIEEEVKVKVWQRIPCGATFNLPLVEGLIPHCIPDKNLPDVRIQGRIRDKNAKGDRLVTLFIVNAQQEPESNRDAAWIFQPEIVVRAHPSAVTKDIFRRRPVSNENGFDAEREAMEMIYRERVEFAVGHGVAVSALPGDTVTRAVEVRTVILPQYEVPVTETPGLEPEDRPTMRKMVENGWLDMQHLASLQKEELLEVLRSLTSDYSAWVDEQDARIGTDVLGHDDEAYNALERCKKVLLRLEEGVQTLATDDIALKAFRFANKAMASQRVRSIYALKRRRGETVDVGDLDTRSNRSWRPFQLAFLLLSVPSLANPEHLDRTRPLEANADLLWFPTGGGKTEAYLGVAAFTMAIRRLQGNLGGYDSARGLAVIMRYTLRLLTLQQFQRGATLICAMELLRRNAIADGDESLGREPFTIGLWVGNKITPGTTEDSHKAITAIRTPGKNTAGLASPAQLTSCPWCGSKIVAGEDIEVDRLSGRTQIFCGDKLSTCEFSVGKSSNQAHPGVPVLVVDEEIYHRPPTMMIATVDKFAMMAWRGQVRALFGCATQECPRHGLLWPEADCTGNHPAANGLPATKVKAISSVRPPDLIIQDEFHLISGPLGTMVGLYETAVDKLCTWTSGEYEIRPKIIASTATVRKAKEQVHNVFMRRVTIFPPHGLDVEDNFFSVQRPIAEKPGRRYLGVCAPGSSRPAVLIRVYTAFLTAAQALFDRFGPVADPYMTTVGYFNSLRELGGMKRLAEDDVQTRAYRVQMSLVQRPGLGQRGVANVKELTSRVSNQDIPKYLDQLEIKFKGELDVTKGKYVTRWQEGELRAIDVVLATNMLSVGVDVNRLGLMVVNGQPKTTAEYIQATSRVGRSFPGLVCAVLTWSRPRDLSHYETFEHYHATFYKHVEAQSVTPFSPRALDRGLTGTMLSIMRLENSPFNPNGGAASLKKHDQSEITTAIDTIAARAGNVTEDHSRQVLTENELKERADEWANEATKPGRILAYEKRGANKNLIAPLIKAPGIQPWDNWTVPMSMREVETGVRLIMNTNVISTEPAWKQRPQPASQNGVQP